MYVCLFPGQSPPRPFCHRGPSVSGNGENWELESTSSAASNAEYTGDMTVLQCDVPSKNIYNFLIIMHENFMTYSSTTLLLKS